MSTVPSASQFCIPRFVLSTSVSRFVYCGIQCHTVTYYHVAILLSLSCVRQLHTLVLHGIYPWLSSSHYSPLGDLLFLYLLLSTNLLYLQAFHVVFPLPYRFVVTHTMHMMNMYGILVCQHGCGCYEHMYGTRQVPSDVQHAWLEFNIVSWIQR